MSDKRQRTAIKSVRYTPEELKVVVASARATGYTTGRYIRESSLGDKPRAKPDRITDDAIYQLARIGNNLNQLAHRANAGNFPSHAEIKSALDEVMKAIEGLV